MNQASATPRRQNAAAAQRAQEAAALRVAGKSWEEIAAATGYSHATGAARAARQHLGQLPQPDREEARAVWRARVEQLWQQSFEDVLARRPGAIRAAAAVAQRAAAMDALDQPTRLELVSPTEQEYAAVLRRMVELDGATRGITAAVEADLFAPEFLDEEPVAVERS